jgi:hypothetical protein
MKTSHPPHRPRHQLVREAGETLLVGACTLAIVIVAAAEWVYLRLTRLKRAGGTR